MDIWSTVERNIHLAQEMVSWLTVTRSIPTTQQVNAGNIWFFILMEEMLHSITLLIFHLTEHRRNAKAPNETADTIRYLCKYMENHYAENLTLTDLAAFSGFNPSYLCRVFKKETGYSPKEYITILRLEQAKGLLCSTSLPAYTNWQFYVNKPKKMEYRI